MALFTELGLDRGDIENTKIDMHRVEWLRDIELFSHLVANLGEMATDQTLYMEMHRQAADKTAASIATSELADLDRKVAATRQQIDELSARILTHEPEDGEDAAKIIGFVAELFQIESSFDEAYLADILQNCAKAIGHAA